MTNTAHPSDRPYRGVPADERRAERRARLIDAFLDVLEQEGLEDVTVRAVGERAGLTRRYFYENFADLDALTVAVFDQVNDEITAALRAAVAEGHGDGLATARAALAAGVQVIADDPRKGALIVASMTATGPLARRRAAVIGVFTAIVAEQARAGAPGASIPNHIIEITAVLLVGGLTQVVASWLAGTIAATREQLVDIGAGLVAGVSETAVRLAAAA